jgi:shikimate dehydrogenase
VLLGFPLGHSHSPAIHNASFRSQGLSFLYEARPVPPDQLESTLVDLKASDFAGANVTVPHKSRILDFLDARSETVEAVGAANTLVWRSGQSGHELYGDNTDVGGFLATLNTGAIPRSPAVVLGSGGAARAVAYALVSSGYVPSVIVAARRLQQGLSVVDDLRAVNPDFRLDSVDLSDAREAVRGAGLIVNATPAGMHPHIDTTPWPHAEDFHAGQLVYDLIYNPLETRLLREARSRGAATVGGIEMLLQQAALSYQQWTGVPMDIEAARAVLIP